MTVNDYFQRVEPLSRQERESFTRVKNAVMRFQIECVLAAKRGEPEPEFSDVRVAVAEFERILGELSAVNRELMSE